MARRRRPPHGPLPHGGRPRTAARHPWDPRVARRGRSRRGRLCRPGWGCSPGASSRRAAQGGTVGCRGHRARVRDHVGGQKGCGFGRAAQRTSATRVRCKPSKGPNEECKDGRQGRERKRTLSLFHTSPNALKHTGHSCGLSFSCTLRSCTLSVQRSANATEHTNACTAEKRKKHAHRQCPRVSRVSPNGHSHSQRPAKMRVEGHTHTRDGYKCMPTYSCHRRCTRTAAGARAPPQCGGGGTPFDQTDTRTADTQTPWPGPRIGRRRCRGASPPPTCGPGSSWYSARRGGSRADSQSARRTTTLTGGHQRRR